MAENSKIASLSDIEKELLKVLSEKEQTVEELSELAEINPDSVRRASAWLSDKEFAKINETKTTKLVLSEEGKKAIEKGLPERRLLNVIAEKGKLSFSEAEKEAELSKQEFNVALGLNKRKAFIIILKENQPMIEITEVAKEFLDKKSDEENAIEEIKEKGKTNPEFAKSLIQRGLCEEKEDTERKIIITKEGKDAINSEDFSKERAYNVTDPVPPMYIGKKQPYIQFLNIIRRKLTELGFVEMESPLIVQDRKSVV